jgi:hypothetical protein
MADRNPSVITQRQAPPIADPWALRGDLRLRHARPSHGNPLPRAPCAPDRTTVQATLAAVRRSGITGPRPEAPRHRPG